MEWLIKYLCWTTVGTVPTDRVRDAFLTRQGITVQRIDADALDFDPDRIGQAVRAAIDKRVLALAKPRPQ